MKVATISTGEKCLEDRVTGSLGRSVNSLLSNYQARTDWICSRSIFPIVQKDEIAITRVPMWADLISEIIMYLRVTSKCIPLRCEIRNIYNFSPLTTLFRAENSDTRKLKCISYNCRSPFPTDCGKLSSWKEYRLTRGTLTSQVAWIENYARFDAKFIFIEHTQCSRHLGIEPSFASICSILRKRKRLDRRRWIVANEKNGTNNAVGRALNFTDYCDAIVRCQR